MPMIQFVPETLILSGEVNANFQNAVSVDTPRSITVSHTWTARQNLLGGILVGAGAGNALQPSLAFELDGSFGPVGFYHKNSDLIGVAGRLDLPGYGVAAGNGIGVSGGGTVPFNVAVRRSADADNALVFGTDGGLFAPESSGGDVTDVVAGQGISVQPDTPSPGDVTVSAKLSVDANNPLSFGSDDGLYATLPPPGIASVVAGDGIDVDPNTPSQGDATVSLKVSDETDNAIRIGTDGGAFAPLGPIKVIGSVDTAADLPSPYAGDIGDSYLTKDDGHIHIWDGSVWLDGGEVRGPPGPTTQITAGDGIDVTGTVPDYTVAAKLSTDARNLTAVADDQSLLTLPALLAKTITADYTVQPSDMATRLHVIVGAPPNMTITVPIDVAPVGSVIEISVGVVSEVTVTIDGGALFLLTGNDMVQGDITTNRGGWLRLVRYSDSSWSATGTDYPGYVPVQPITQDSNYTLTPAAVGKIIRASGSATDARIWTIPQGAGMPTNGTVWVHNASAAVITLTIDGNTNNLRFLDGQEYISGDITIPSGGWLILKKISLQIWEAVGLTAQSGVVRQGVNLNNESSPYTLQMGDVGAMLSQTNHAVAFKVVLPPTSAVPIPNGATFLIVVPYVTQGLSSIDLIRGTGVSLRAIIDGAANDSDVRVGPGRAWAYLLKVSGNSWYVLPGSGASSVLTLEEEEES